MSMSSRFWIRAAQFRGALLPLGVALIMIAALALYGLVWIPAQQQYLNERNLQLLQTINAQIKGKVDGFDQAIDHAIDSFLPPKVGKADFSKEEPTGFSEKVRAFAPDLEILQEPEEQSAEKIIYDHPGDPPRVAIQKDEGKDYL